MSRKKTSKNTAGPRSVALTSGKGGVGKSCIALNLATHLATRGERVLLLDGDLGLGNVALLLGVDGEWTFEDVLLGRSRIAESVVEGPNGLAVLPASTEGGSDFWDQVLVEAPLVEDLESFASEFDVLVVDTGAGIADKTLDLVVAVDEVLLVITPEPAAIADAYAMFKALLSLHPDLVGRLVVNMADSADEAMELYDKFSELVARFLGAEIDNRGYIPLDRYVREAVKHQVPFSLVAPPSPAAKALEQLAGQFGSDGVAVPSSGVGFFTRALGHRVVGAG